MAIRLEEPKPAPTKPMAIGVVQNVEPVEVNPEDLIVQAHDEPDPAVEEVEDEETAPRPKRRSYTRRSRGAAPENKSAAGDDPTPVE
jgi:hypothetical protein